VFHRFLEPTGVPLAPQFEGNVFPEETFLMRRGLLNRSLTKMRQNATEIKKKKSEFFFMDTNII